MSDFTFPESKVTVKEGDGSVEDMVRCVEYIHIDDLRDDEQFTIPHIYAYEDEDRADELEETITELRGQFIFARGVVWPNWMRDEMPLETEVLNALEWVIALVERPEPEMIPIIREELQEQ